MVNFTPISAAIGGGLIGLSAVLLMLLTGRIAGISGIFGGLLDFRSEDKDWRIAFIAGLILAPLIAGWIGYAMPPPKLPASWTVIIWSVSAPGWGAAVRQVTASVAWHGCRFAPSLRPSSLCWQRL